MEKQNELETRILNLETTIINLTKQLEFQYSELQAVKAESSKTKNDLEFITSELKKTNKSLKEVEGLNWMIRNSAKN